MMDLNWKKSAILRNITELEKHNQAFEKFEFLNKFITISDLQGANGQTLCNECDKPIEASEAF